MGATIVSTLVALALMLTTAIATRSDAAPTAPTPIFVDAYEVEGDCIVRLLRPKVKLGYPVTWQNEESKKLTVRETKGLWTIELTADGTYKGRAWAAGSFRQDCDDDPMFSNTMRVPPKAPATPTTSTFRVTWAVAGAKAFWRYRVEYRIGSGAWKVWRPKTAGWSAVFSGQTNKVYGFRVATVNSKNGEASNWSPIRKVST